MQGEDINTPHIRYTQREPFSYIYEYNVSLCHLFSVSD